MDSMPILEYKNLQKILNGQLLSKEKRLPRKSTTEFRKESRRTPKKPENNEELSDMALVALLENESFIDKKIKKTSSLPEINESKLDDEFDIDKRKLVHEKFKTTDVININYNFGLKVHDGAFGHLLKQEDLNKQDEKKVSEDLKEDLRSLTWRITRKQLSNLEKPDDAPALLMTLMAKANHKEIMENLARKIEKIDEKYKRFEEEIKLSKRITKKHPQPATVENNNLTGYPIRLSDLRVSSRMLRSDVSLHSYGPLYNEMNNEIDSDMVKQLDSNLSVGDEIKKVYDELLKTINENYLLFNLDDYVQPTPDNIDHKSSFASSVLVKSGQNLKFLNEGLKISNYNNPPWQTLGYREWNKTPLTDVIDPTAHSYRPVKGKAKTIKPLEPTEEKVKQYENVDPSQMDAKEYKIWLRWWKEHYSSQDYLKYLSTQQSDFLGYIFHLYDKNNNATPDMTDEEIIISENRKKAEQERAKLIKELRFKKAAYESDKWNPETVLLGGLGKEPELDNSIDPLKIFEKSLQRPVTRTKKVDLFRQVEKSISHDDKSNDKSETEYEVKIVPKTPQQRLEKIWTLLRMPDSSRLDMVVKYCSDNYIDKLLEAIEAWEALTDLIIKREKCIHDLEIFEKEASNPNRFFQKGQSSGARLQEARYRDACYKKIDKLEKEIKKLISEVEKKYNDTITYNGRNYLDKMKWDRIEMLHWLQEERRKNYFGIEISNKNLSLNSIK